MAFLAAMAAIAESIKSKRKTSFVFAVRADFDIRHRLGLG